MSSPFDPKSYYRFFNSVYPNHTISQGLYINVNGAVNMTQSESFSSSENWQLFYQSGLYFIRNYQGGVAVQLGLTADNLAVPRLLNASGDLGQQWKLNQWSDGTYRVTNGLVSNSSSLGIAQGGATVPAMDTDDADGHWAISINVSAGSVSDAMLVSVSNVQAAPTTSTASSTASPTSTGTTTGTSTSISSNSPATTSAATTNSSKSSSISGGAIAGIVIGVLALAAIIAALSFFLIRRRRQNASSVQPRSELDGTDRPAVYENEKRVTPAAPPIEMDAEQQPVRTEVGYK